MIAILPKIYNDEILYSIIARYHVMSGNPALKDTLDAAFGNKASIATLEFPCHLEHLASQIYYNNGFNSDYLVKKTTLFPLYAPFLSENRKNEILKDIKYGDGKGVKYKVGFIAGGICKKSEIYYCPQCVQTEISELMEIYIHRLHQVQGIHICNKHLCRLVSYGNKRNRSRLEFISLREEDIINKCDYINDSNLLHWQVDICNFVQYILENDLSHLNQDLINERYLQLLREKGFMTARGTIKQTELVEAFKLFYGERILDIMESNITMNSDHSWLHQISRKPKSAIHPIRHILFMRFLCNDPAAFFCYSKNESTNPFGDGPWPCLNICCKNYKKPAIKKCIVSADYKTREPIGTFKCKCGFIYSRKSKDDEHTIGRIKAFGDIWEGELRKLINNGTYTLRYMARMLDCDPKTVVKYTDKLNLRHLLNSKMGVSYTGKTQSGRENGNIVENYKEDILNLLRICPNITRQEIRKSLYKQYVWLYRNEKEWLYSDISPGAKTNIINNRVNWEERDNEICEKLKLEYEKLMSSDKPVRITKSMISRRIGKQELVDKWLDKLPRTKQLIEDIVETVEQFQNRRVNIICEKLLESDKLQTRWQIIRSAGLGKEIACSIDKVIDHHIKQQDITLSNQ